MNCRRCGAPLSDGAPKCWKCGEAYALEAMSAQELRKKAGFEFMSDNYQKTLEILEYASRIASPDNPELATEIFVMKGISLFKLGRWPEALQAYNRAMIFGPLDFQLWYHKGEVLFYLGSYHEALAAFDRALQIDPEDYLGLATAGKENTLRMLQGY